MRKILLVFLFALSAGLGSESLATHVVGGEITYEFIDQLGTPANPFRYRIRMSLYVDRNPPSNFPSGIENNIGIGIYNAANNQRLQTLTLNPVVQNVDPPLPANCTIPGIDSVNVTLNVYTAVVSLPVSFSGFWVVWQRCCRNNGVLNLLNSASQGNTFITFIPPSIYRNSSPQFTDLAIPALCRGDTTSFINNAVDPDGDKLIYNFVQPYTGASPGNAAPFPPFTYIPPPPFVTLNTAGGYSVAAPFGPNGFAEINASTGLSRYMAPMEGLNVVAIEIQEFRNVDGTDILLGSTRRELQLISKQCPANPTPVFSDNGNNSTVVINTKEGQNITFTVNATDANNDSLEITATSNVLTGGAGYSGPLATLPFTAGRGNISSTFNWNPGCGVSGTFTVNVSIKDLGCPPKTSNRTYLINIEKFKAPASIQKSSKTIRNKVDSICINDRNQSYFATGQSGSTFQWLVSQGSILSQSGSAVSLRWDSAAISGNLQLVETSTLGCRDTVQMTGRVFDFATAQIADTLRTVCQGSSTVMNATSTSGFSWTPSTGLSSTFIGNPTATPTTNTLYRVFPLAVIPGCSFGDSIQVNVAPVLRAAGPDRTTCSGNAVQLGQSTVSGFQYLWTGDVPVPDSTVAQPLVPVTATARDTVQFILRTQSTEFNCVGLDTARVFINPLPTSTLSRIGASGQVCLGSSVSFSVALSGVAPYRVEIDSNGTSLVFNNITAPSLAFSRTFNIVGTFSFFVKSVRSGDSCFQAAPGTPIEVQVVPPTNVALTRGDTGSLCSGASSTLSFHLTGRPPYTLQVDSSGTLLTFPNLTISPFLLNRTYNTPGIYTWRAVSVVDSLGCLTTVSSPRDTIVVNPLPTAALNREDGPGNVCFGDSIRLRLVLTGTAPWTVVLDSGGVLLTFSNITASPFVFSRRMGQSTAVSYFVTQVSDGKGCINSADGTPIAFTVNPLPTAVLTRTSPLAPIVCRETDVTFRLALTGTPPWTVQVDSNGVVRTLSGVGATPFDFTRRMSGVGAVQFFMAQVSDANGCTNPVDGAAISFFVKELPTAQLSFDQPDSGYCIRDTAAFTINLTGTSPWSVVLDSAGSTQVLSTGVPPIVLLRRQVATGLFPFRLVQVTDSLCTVVNPDVVRTVRVNALPTAQLIRTGNTGALCAGDTARFRLLMTGAGPWTVRVDSMGIPLTFSGITTPLFDFVRRMRLPGTYTFSVRSVGDGNSCDNDSTGATVQVVVNPYPQVALLRTNPGELCFGDSARFSLNLTGTAPWSVDIDSGGVIRTLTGIGSSPFAFARVMNGSGTFVFRAVSVNDATGCRNDTAGTALPVVVNPLPTAALNREDGPGNVCFGDSIRLRLVLTGTAPWTVVLDSGGVLLTFSNITASPFVFSRRMGQSTAVSYFVTQVSDGKGCINPVDGTPVTFTVNPLPTATFTRLSPTGALVCKEDMVNFSMNLTGTAPWTVRLDSNGTQAQVFTGIASSPFLFARRMSGVGQVQFSIVQVSDANGCTILPTGLQINYGVKELPTAQLAFSAPPVGVCLNDSVVFTIDLTGTPNWSVTIDSAGVSRVLNSSTTPIQFLRPQLATGSYSFTLVQVSDSLCSVSNPDSTRSFRVNPLPPVDAGVDDSICSAISRIIGSAAFPGWSYRWRPSLSLSDSAIAQPVFSPINNGAFPILTSLTVQARIDSTGCINQDTVRWVVNPNPVANAGPDIQICSSDTAQIGTTAVSGWSYLWSAPIAVSQSTTAQPFFTNALPNGQPSVTQQAVLTVTNAVTLCVATDSVSLTTHSRPLFNLGPDQIICSGVPAVLNFFLPTIYSFEWLDTSGVSVKNSPSTTITVFNNTLSSFPVLYRLLITDLATGCTWVDTIQITVLPSPRADAGPDVTLCSGDTVPIGTSPTSGHTYIWNPASISVPELLDRTASSTSITLSTSGVSLVRQYVVQAFFNGCDNTDTVRVTVNPNPDNPVITGGVSICPGASDVAYFVPFVLGNTYFWGVNGGSIASGQGSDTVRINWGGNNSSAFVSVLATNGFGCISDTVQRAVLINPVLLTQLPQGTDSLCNANAGSVTYSVVNTNGSTYNWSVSNGTLLSPNGSNTITVAWNGPGIGSIWLTETAIFDTLCFGSSDTLTVTILPEPSTVALILGNVNPCAFSSDVVYHTIGLPGSTYDWSVVGGNIVSGQGSDSIRVNWGSAGSGVVRFREVSFFGCLGDTLDTATTIRPIPSPMLSGNDTIVCAQRRDSLVYSVSGFAGSSFQWIVTGGSVLSGQGTDSLALSWDNAGIRSLKVIETSTFGCMDSSVVLSIFYDDSRLRTGYVSRSFAGADSLVLLEYLFEDEGNFTDEFRLFRRYTSVGSLAPWVQVFSTQASTLSASSLTLTNVAPQRNGIAEYRAEVKNLCGIRLESDVHTTMQLTANAIEDRELSQLKWNAYINWNEGGALTGYEIFRKLNTDTGYKFVDVVSALDTSWSAPNADDGFEHCYMIKAQQALPSGAIAWSSKACISFLHVINIANMLSANGDGLNDTWIIDNAELYNDLKVTILNRWGKVVYTSENYKNDWSAQGLEVGTYYYSVRVRGQERIGYIQVIR